MGKRTVQTCYAEWPVKLAGHLERTRNLKDAETTSSSRGSEPYEASGFFGVRQPQPDTKGAFAERDESLATCHGRGSIDAGGCSKRGFRSFQRQRGLVYVRQRILRNFWMIVA
ncbi:hypothetical protein KM043_013021 [Ampulex compressa]|nr:hypothetical protein KM043_013021 [Ampulex compressa]